MQIPLPPIRNDTQDAFPNALRKPGPTSPERAATIPNYGSGENGSGFRMWLVMWLTVSPYFSIEAGHSGSA